MGNQKCVIFLFEHSEAQAKYANRYCWVRNTYYLPNDEYIPKEYERRDTIRYYQWITFILIGQALFFYIPSVVWHCLNQKSGVDADSILAAANTFDDTEKVLTLFNCMRLIFGYFLCAIDICQVAYLNTSLTLAVDCINKTTHINFG